MTDVETFFFESDDGLRLSGRRHPGAFSHALPLVCLPGLTRNARDFDALAEAIACLPGSPPLIAFDYRGRGRSAWAADPSSYTVPREAADVLTGLAHLGIKRAVFVGTSRGALIIQVLALLQPRLIAGAVLNDAGPRIEAEGLALIRAYLTGQPPAPDWETATARVRAALGATFPALTDADFAEYATAGHTETAAGIVGDYDPRLTEALALLDLDQPLPELWPAFAALHAVPVLVIRGEHSRLLSRETVKTMGEQHPALRAIEVAGQGHAPLLETGELPLEILALAARAALARNPATID